MAPPYYSETIFSGLDIGAGRFKGYYNSNSEAQFYSGGSPLRAFGTPHHAARPARFGRRAAALDGSEGERIPTPAVLPRLPNPPKALPVPLPPFAAMSSSAAHESLRQRPVANAAPPPRRRRGASTGPNDAEHSTPADKAEAQPGAASPSPQQAADAKINLGSIEEIYLGSPDPTGLFLRRKFGRREGFGRRRYAE